MIANSEIPAKLIRSTIKQSGSFEYFKESAEDITKYGIDRGFSGFIYYVDTCNFFKRNKKDIIAFAEFQAQEIGYKSLLEMFKTFKCIKLLVDVTDSEILQAVYQNKGELKDQIQNCLAWYACEEVCRLYCDLISQD